MWSALLAALVSLAPCPPGTPPVVSLGTRDRLAFERQSLVEVLAAPGTGSAVLSDLRFDLFNTEGRGFLSYAFAPSELPGVEVQTWRRFPVKLHRGDPPIVARLSYVHHSPEAPGGCELTQQRVIRGFGGFAPRFNLQALSAIGEALLEVRARDGCGVTTPGPVVVEVTGGGRSAVRRLRDFCDINSRWRANGSIPRLHFRSPRDDLPAWTVLDSRELSIVDASHVSRKAIYRVDVRWGHQLVLRRWLLTRTRRFSDRWYGAELCRGLDLKVHRGPNGRAYCLDPDWEHFLTLHPRRPSG
jgi:hypothetical protein